MPTTVESSMAIPEPSTVAATTQRPGAEDEGERRRARAAAATRHGHFKMLTARATTRMPTTSEIADSAIIMSLAHGLTADTSVGLKAVAVAKAKWK